MGMPTHGSECRSFIVPSFLTRLSGIRDYAYITCQRSIGIVNLFRIAGLPDGIPTAVDASRDGQN
jgi:hypothetical protein